MRYNTTINNVKALEWGLNIQQAYLFAWIYELPSWADRITLDGIDYYYADRRKVIEELPALTDKPDTVYRHYKDLEKHGLIVLKKIDGKDYVGRTAKAKTWNYTERGNEQDPNYIGNSPQSEYSEKFPSDGNKSEHSEINPNELGKISESNSEKFPTYNIISIYNNINNNNIIYAPKNFSVLDFKKILLHFGAEEKLIDEWLSVRKTKRLTNTVTALKQFLHQVELSETDINEVLTLCVIKSWGGFEADWLLKEKKSSQTKKIDYEEIARKARSENSRI